MSEVNPQMERIRRVLMIAALAGLAILFYSTIHPFVAALAWSIVLAISLWPLYRGLRKRLPGPPAIAPLVMCFLITLGLVVPLGLVGLLVVGEAETLIRDVSALISGEKGDLMGWFDSVPFWSKNLKAGLEDLRKNPGTINAILDQNRDTLIGLARRAMGGLIENAFRIAVCIFSAYFLFRHGEVISEQIKRGVNRLGGPRLEGLLPQMKETVRAVVFGLVMTAIAQAIVAAIGFYAAGVGYPLLLAILIFVFSFIPFGPPIIWIPAALSVFVEGRPLAGVFVFIWGAGVISMMDNVLRPIFIGQATNMPILFVFIAVLGGIMSFGMIGLFVGPVVIAVALTLWRDWIARREAGLYEPPLWAAPREN